MKEKIKKKYEDMKRVLDEDLRITLTQLEMEAEATERVIEDQVERCYALTQDIDRELSELSARLEKQLSYDKVTDPKLNDLCPSARGANLGPHV